MSTPYELLHITTPDTLRAVLRSNKNLYDTCVKREYNFKELSQNLQYSGTVENFGSEVLLESRKLNEKYIFPESVFSKDVVIANVREFFEPVWSPLTPTTEQCPIIQCDLKDIFLDNHVYKIYIENAELVCFPRSDSTSDPNVHKSFFYVCKYVEESIFNNVLFSDMDDTTHFGENKIIFTKGDNERQMGFYVNDFTRDRINIIPDGGRTRAEITFTNHDKYLPWLWYYSKYESEAYTQIELSGDTTDTNGHDLINFGTDGHGNMFGYFLLYGEENVPIGIYNENNWFIRCYPDTNVEPFNDGYDNYKKKIKTIVIGYGDDEHHLTNTYTINVDNYDDVKLLLNRNIPWDFYTPQEGDDVYGTNNSTYASISLFEFEENVPDDATLIPAFVFESIIDFDNDNRLYANMNLKNGIHLDTSSDECDNGIPTKNGSIHSLGDFNGIPEYFHRHLDPSIHRIHAEIYSINEDAAQWKPTMEKQTAALLFDTGLPHNDLNTDTSDLKMNIKYDFDPGRQFSSIEEPEDPNNALSEAVFIDQDNFGTSVEAKYSMNPKFVYHGKRVFSLSKSGLLPEEIGRVYYLSNDSISYTNNEISNDKYPLTMARICDIPTSFLQLIQIEGKSPCIVIDKKYVRSECSFSEDDKRKIWNYVHPMFISDGNTYVPSYKAELEQMPIVMNMTFDSSLINDIYAHYSQLFGNLDLNNTSDYSIAVVDAGSGYEVDDIISCMIGGNKVKFKVDTVSPMSGVTGVTMMNLSDYVPIDKSLFETKITVYTMERESSHGEDCRISLSISNSKWDTFIPYKGDPSVLIDILGLCRDPYDNLWVLKYDPTLQKWNVLSQLTGVPYRQNYYDETRIEIDDVWISRSDRSVLNVFLYNKFKDNILCLAPEINIDTYDETDIDMDDVLNIQNMTYTMYEDQGESVVKYAGQNIHDGSNIVLLPRFNQFNTEEFKNHTNKIHIMKERNNVQTIPFIYEPFKTYKDYYTGGRYTRGDLLSLREYYNDFIDQSGVLQSNIIEYNLYKMNTILEANRITLDNLPLENIHEFIYTIFPQSDIIDNIENYSKEYLINYIMMNMWTYLKNDKTMLRPAGSVVEADTKPVGEQQTGWFEYLNDYHDPDVTVNAVPLSSTQFNVFKIEDSSILTLDSFRIYDEYDNDISSSSLILFGDRMYYFNTNRWVNIHDIS